MNGNESSNEPLPSLAVYNPALLKKEDLIAQFVARRPLLDRLVGELQRGGKNGHQHHLIVGSRGSGKTTLLRRLRYAIEDDAELSSRYVPLVFPEEQYNVSRLSDLWVNCLDALGDTLERQDCENEANWLDQQINKLPADDEKRRAQAALDLLIGWAMREDRGLILLFDNSDLVFDRLKGDHWAIREVLSADNRLLFIGATSAPIEATYNHEGAFYDFFKIHEMRGLTDQETREVIFNLAQLRRTPHVIETLEREPGRIRTLNLLTGGNLRTIVVLYQVLAQGKDDSIRADLEQLLDQYTPLYKHRFETMSRQSQQIVDALALNWNPTTAADLAGKLRMDTNAVSAVLNRLVSDGVVEKVQSPPGEKIFFQIAERFFNIWYLMRASRRVRRALIWLAEFLKMFYGMAGLSRRARRLLRRPRSRERNQSHRAELALAYARAVKEPALRRALENEGIRSLMSCRAEDRQSIRAMFDFDGEDASLKNVVERFQTLSELSEKIERAKGKLPAEIWDHLIAAPSMSLEEKNKTAEQISKLGLDECKPLIEKFTAEAEQLTENFGAEACQELFEAIRSGDMEDGADVEGADAAAIKWNDASLKVIARLARFDKTRDKALLDQAENILPRVKAPHVWLSLVEKVAGLEGEEERLNRVYRDVSELNDLDSCAWYRVGKLLKYYLKRYTEAEAAYRKSVDLNPDAGDPWGGLGHLLAEYLGQFEEAEAAYRKAIELDPADAAKWDDFGDLLQYHLKRYEEAESAYHKSIELDSNSAHPWDGLGDLLQNHLGRYEEAETAYRKAIEIDPNDATPWDDLGRLLQNHLERYEEAETAYRKAIELDPNDAMPWNGLGNLLLFHLNRHEDAEKAFRKAVKLDPNFAEPWVGLGIFMQDHLKRYEEAEDAYRQAIKLNPNFAWPWKFLGDLLQYHLKRYEDAEGAYRKAIDLDPNFAWPWRDLGTLFHYTMSERLDEAEPSYRKAIELAPRDADTWHNLGYLLGDRLNRPEEAEEAYRKAVELDENNAEYLNSLAWQLYLLNKALDEAELHSRRSVELEPSEINYTHTLANILIRRGKWDEAVVFARQFIVEGDDEYHEENWPHIISFFRDTVATGHSEEAVALLDETKYGERWHPLREALQAIAEDDSSYLLRVAPEIRQPAEEIVAMLLPEGSRLGGAPMSMRARRTSRKRSLD